MRNVLMRIFWPFDTGLSQDAGVVIGFKNSDLDFVVVTVLKGQEPCRIQEALEMDLLCQRSPYPLSTLFHQCGRARLQVLGLINPVSPLSPTFDHSCFPLILLTNSNSRFPRIEQPSVCHKRTDEGLVIQWIGFHRPSPSRMQFFSLSPIALSLDDKSDAYKWVAPLDRIDEAEEKEKKRKGSLVEKLKQHTVIERQCTSQDLSLPDIIEQINCSSELAALLRNNERILSALKSRRSLSVSERMAEKATSLGTYLLGSLTVFWFRFVYPAVLQVLVLLLIGFRIFAELLLKTVEWRPFSTALAAKDVSATAQQIDVRLQQFCYWPIQYMTLRDRKQNWQSITTTHPEYIRFYNSVWLVANDMIIGLALGSYLMDNSDCVSRQIDHILTNWALNGLREMIVWLMGWPAGLKLNTELAAFLGELFLWVIDYWASYIALFRPHLSSLIYYMGWVSLTGATMPISMFSDLISVLTVHIGGFYLSSAKIYHWQLTILFSLFHLFRGKKHNVLRNRIDNCDYDLDQLLLGTILFTILSFLLPTVLVFYVTFAGARMVIIAVKALLETGLAFLNHFPLFALMLRVKDSRRLPSGIRFELVDPIARTPRCFFLWKGYPTFWNRNEADHPVSSDLSLKFLPSFADQSQASPPSTALSSLPPFQSAYVLLQSVPLPLHLTFHSYIHLFSRLRSHYMSFRVVVCLLTGRLVPPLDRKNLYRLQYSMLPVRRVGVWDLWARLRSVCDGNRTASGQGGVVLTKDERIGSKGENFRNGEWDVAGDEKEGGARGGSGTVVPDVVVSAPGDGTSGPPQLSEESPST